jgi:hypothetical protein
MPAAPQRLALLLVALLLLAACDGETAETEVGSDDPQVQEDEFALQADGICQGTRAELQLLREELFEREDETAVRELEPGDAQRSLERAAALLRTELAQLEELDPPEGQEEAVADWINDVRVAALSYEQGASSPEAAQQRLDAGDPLASAEERADDLGLGVCGTEDLPSDEIGDPETVPTEDEE